MPPDFVGGIGMEGAANVRRFVERGGWLVAWDRASDFAILALDLPLRNSVSGHAPGRVLHPRLAAAHQHEAREPAGRWHGGERHRHVRRLAGVSGRRAGGRRQAARGADVDVYVEYPRQNFMVSGWELGGSRYLAGRVAAAHVKVGKGHAVVMGFRPHWRGQPHNTFKLLFNPLYLSTRQEGVGTAQ